MPLRKFSDEEFDNMVRTKFESAPLPAYDPSAWSKFNLHKQKMSWVPKAIYTGLTGLLLLLAGVIVLERTEISLDDSQAVDRAFHNSVLTPDQDDDCNSDEMMLQASLALNNDEGCDDNGTIANLPMAIQEANNVNAKGENGVRLQTINTKPYHQKQSFVQATNINTSESQVTPINLSEKTVENGNQQNNIINASASDFVPFEIDKKEWQDHTSLNTFRPTGVQWEEPVKEEKKRTSRWSAGIVLNGDLTTVRLKNFTGPGSGIGVRGTFSVTDRISIVSGINRVKKIYNVTDEGDVTLPPGYWDNNDFPDEIAATCTVTEIPVNIRFDLIKLPKGRVYGLAGLNSFLMNRELYEWDYGSGIYASTASLDIRKENKHYFGVLNLSGGYQHQVNDHFSLGIESYYQSTLAGVGFYQISLKSIGNQVIFNYHF